MTEAKVWTWRDRLAAYFIALMNPALGCALLEVIRVTSAIENGEHSLPAPPK